MVITYIRGLITPLITIMNLHVQGDMGGDLCGTATSDPWLNAGSEPVREQSS